MASAPDGQGSCWDDVVDLLVSEGIDQVVGLPGDDLEAVSAFADSPITPRWVRDQRVAVGMAAGAALSTGRAAVCVVGRGPGAAAAVPWTMEAHSAGAPVLVISGGVPAGSEGRAAFQDAPLVELFAPVTKRAVRVTHADSTVPELVRSLAVATDAAPGPVFVELADGLGRGRRRRSTVMSVAPGPGEHAAAGLIRDAVRPVLLVGGGCAPSEGRLAQSLAERWDVPVFCSASGRGAVDERHPCFLGLGGLYARGQARAVIAEADLVIALGSRLEETVTMGWPEGLAVVQVTTEPAHLATHRPGVGVVASARRSLEAWLDDPSIVPAGGPAGAAGRRRRIVEARAEGERWAAEVSDSSRGPDGGVGIPGLLRALAARLPENSVVVHENGLADIWTYHFPVFTLPCGALDLCPSEQTTLGFGAVAALGASRAHPDRFVVSVVGDGALAGVVRDTRAFADPDARVLWIVLDNGGYGWLQFAGEPRWPGLFASDDDRMSCPPNAGGVEVRMAGAEEPVDQVVAEAVDHVRSRGSLILAVPVSLEDRPPAATDPPAGP